jgi:inhibitor of KinA sporulation pathway (predicted exonuclease)
MQKTYDYQKPIEIFTALDLEMNQPSGKIIQIGACVGNIVTGEILETLSLFVNPEELLSPFIVGLTGIKQQDVDTGLSLEEAYSKLKEFHIKHKSFMNPITWGGGDSQEILRQLREKYDTDRGFRLLVFWPSLDRC